MPVAHPKNIAENGSRRGRKFSKLISKLAPNKRGENVEAIPKPTPAPYIGNPFFSKNLVFNIAIFASCS